MVKTEGNTRKSYALYKKTVEQPKDIKLYISIANGYMQFLSEKLIDGEEITLPARMGTLALVGSKKKLRFHEDGRPILPPNWQKTKKLWDNNPIAKQNKKLVYCTGEETNGVNYKFRWFKIRVAIENKTLYSIRMTRKNKRDASAAIKSGKEYFIKQTG